MGENWKGGQRSSPPAIQIEALPLAPSLLPGEYLSFNIFSQNEQAGFFNFQNVIPYHKNTVIINTFSCIIIRKHLL